MQTYCPYCMKPVKAGSVYCTGCGKNPSSYVPNSHHLPPGSRLKNRYVLGGVLGEGDFGITYLGQDTHLERRVAIKEYFPVSLVQRSFALSPEVECHSEGQVYQKGREKFLQEARIMARLANTPEIVHILDFFPENQTAYIVMEFLEGKTLKELASQTAIEASTLLSLMEPVLRALSAIHQQGLIHRDLNPESFMRLNNGKMKLIDFGCVRDIDNTQTAASALKHGYAPIEQYDGGAQGAWTDVYAVCATMYYCLTQETPPRATARHESGSDPLVPLGELDVCLTGSHGLTDSQERAVMKGLAVRPEDRFQSIEELYAALYDRPVPSGKGRENQSSDSSTDQEETEDSNSNHTVWVRKPVPSQSREESNNNIARQRGSAKNENLPKQGNASGSRRSSSAAPVPNRDGTKKPPKWRLLLAVIVPLVLAVVGVSAFLYVSSTMKMPDLYGQTEDEARETLSSADYAGDLNIEYLWLEMDESIPAGYVSGQSADAETTIQKKDPLSLKVSLGAYAPLSLNYGDDWQSALSAINGQTDAGLSCAAEIVVEQGNDSYRAGQLCGWQLLLPFAPEDGSTAFPGEYQSMEETADGWLFEQPDFIADSGTALLHVCMPDCTGQREKDAVSLLNGAGFTQTDRIVSYSNSVAKGNVVDVAYDEHGGYQLTVSSGPEQVLVPDIRGKTPEEANEALKALGLKGSQMLSSGMYSAYGEGLVGYQLTEPDTTVDWGSTVRYYTSAGTIPENTYSIRLSTNHLTVERGGIPVAINCTISDNGSVSAFGSPSLGREWGSFTGSTAPLRISAASDCPLGEHLVQVWFLPSGTDTPAAYANIYVTVAD